MTQSLKWFLLLQFVNRVDKLRTLKKKKKDQHKNEETKEEHSKQQYTEQPEGG
jgi:hypothetical protein